MQRSERLPLVVSAVVEQGASDVAALARRFAVSEATVRRDLAVLEGQRLVRRTRGGAVPHVGFHDVPLAIKSATGAAAKRRIAAAAVDLVGGARSIGMTGGTTVLEAARLLAGRHRGTVLTSALNVAAALVAAPGVRVLLAGGEVRASSEEVVGPAAEAFLADWHVDVALVGVDAVEAAAGLTNYDPAGARVNAALCTSAARVVVLADASKLGRTALARVADLDAVEALVTDADADPAALRAIEARGCRVVTA